MTLIAINVLLDPDAATVEKAQSINARLRENYPDGFALVANHAPHITILQRFVRTADLDEVANAVAEVLRTEQSMKADKEHPWESKAIGFYDLADKKLALVGIVIEPTEDLRRLQQRIIDAVAPFAVEQGTGEAFAPRPDGGAIGQPDFPHTTPFMFGVTSAISVGADPGAPVAPFYETPFDFTGTLHSEHLTSAAM